jgi:hypothetical protein
MIFGGQVAKQLELGELKLLALEQYDVRELELKADLNGVPLLGRIDNFDPDTLLFRDNKTGKRVGGKSPWDSSRAYKDKQLLFYGVMIRMIYGKAPKKGFIDWLETEYDENQNLRLTGNVEVFECPLTKARLDKMEQEIIKVANEISDAYKKELNSI